MAKKNLVIVESPAKAKTIEKILKSDEFTLEEKEAIVEASKIFKKSKQKRK